MLSGVGGFQLGDVTACGYCLIAVKSIEFIDFSVKTASSPSCSVFLTKTIGRKSAALEVDVAAVARADGLVLAVVGIHEAL